MISTNPYFNFQGNTEQDLASMDQHLIFVMEMPVNKTFRGAYCGMCSDKYDIHRLLNFTYTKK